MRCPAAALLAVTTIFLLGTLLAAAALPAAKPQAATSSDPASTTLGPSYAASIEPLVAQYCAGCHSGAQPPGGVNLAKYSTDQSVLADSATWQKAADNLAALKMPPEGMPQPTKPERARMVDWIQSTLSTAGCKLSDPGRVTLRRLSRQEYDNTVDDLLHVTLRPAAAAFPGDDVGYGFDNNGDVLSLSPLLLEKYLDAAEQLAQAAIPAPESLNQTTRFSSTDLRQLSTGQPLPNAPDNTGAELYSNDEAYAVCRFPAAGDYLVRIRAYGQQAGPDRCRMSIRLDHAAVGPDIEVPQTQSSPGVFTAKLHIGQPGDIPVGAAFTNDYYNAANPDPNKRDRNFVVCRIAVQGPTALPAAPPGSERLLLPRTPSSRAGFRACAEADLAPFAARAFRRPATEGELARLLACFTQGLSGGASFQRGMQVAVEAVLCSPSFLYRSELDPRLAAPRAHPLTSYEMASRLSYFLWSSMPDDTLLRLAAENKLQQPAVLQAQIARMLRDSKSRALATDFADQWLELRKLDIVAPDHSQFPQYDARLRDSMRTESELYFQNIVAQNRSIIEFLDSDYTFLNQPLAQLYDIPNVAGDNFRRVTLPDHDRGGVLTQASVLTVTSNPTRTSPVKRGKWVLVELLGTPPPPPPPGVPQLADSSNAHGPLAGTLRDRMIQHRTDPACAACHKSMDPLGFGLENFNAIGQWRTQDSNSPIDASGVLPTGARFNGPAELKSYLLTRKDQFNRAFAEKMLTFALGRGLTDADRCNVDKIAASVKSHDYKFSSLIAAIVLSPPFRQRDADFYSSAPPKIRRGKRRFAAIPAPYQTKPPVAPLKIRKGVQTTALIQHNPSAGAGIGLPG